MLSRSCGLAAAEADAGIGAGSDEFLPGACAGSIGTRRRAAAWHRRARGSFAAGWAPCMPAGLESPGPATRGRLAR